ncbi:1-deoxy-D-xylulose-5-phosphate reductoisomerase, partial [Klebsiella pneumoniae]
MKQLTVLGSTGSIGCSTLDVVRHNPGRFSVAALVAGKNVDRMVEQCLEFTPRYAVMDDAQSAERLRTRLHEHGSRTEVLSGQQAAAEIFTPWLGVKITATIQEAISAIPTIQNTLLAYSPA